MSTEEERLLRLDAEAEALEGKRQDEDEDIDFVPRVGVPITTVGAIVVMYVQGIVLALTAYFMLQDITADEPEDPFTAYPPRLTSMSWQTGTEGSELIPTFLFLLAGLFAVVFILAATMLIRLEWRGIAMGLQGAVLVPAVLVVLSQEELPAATLLAVPVTSLIVVALLATKLSTKAFQRRKARKKDKGELDILRLIGDVYAGQAVEVSSSGDGSQEAASPDGRPQQ